MLGELFEAGVAGEQRRVIVPRSQYPLVIASDGRLAKRRASLLVSLRIGGALMQRNGPHPLRRAIRVLLNGIGLVILQPVNSGRRILGLLLGALVALSVFVPLSHAHEAHSAFPSAISGPSDHPCHGCDCGGVADTGCVSFACAAVALSPLAGFEPLQVVERLLLPGEGHSVSQRGPAPELRPPVSANLS